MFNNTFKQAQTARTKESAAHRNTFSATEGLVVYVAVGNQ